MVPVFPIDLTASAPIKRSQSPSPPQSNSRKAKASLPPGKATAKRPKDNRPASAPLPLSLREQQVCEYFSQGFTFEAIANRLGLSPAAAKEYHRRALDKHQRMTAFAPAPLEKSESYARRLRDTTATLEPAIAESPHMDRSSCRSGDERSLQHWQSSVCDRPTFTLPNRCERKLRTQSVPFHSSAQETSALCPNPLELSVSSLFVTGDRVAAGSPSFSQATIPDHSRHPRRCKSSSHRSRKAGVDFGLAAAS